MLRRKYRLLPHTADVMVRAYGSSLEELFENASYALASVMYDRRGVRITRASFVDFDGYDLEDLLYNFLKTVFSEIAVESFLYRKASVTIDIEELKGRALLEGESLVQGRHRFRGEVKAVTYHHLEIVERSGGYTATFVLDV